MNTDEKKVISVCFVCPKAYGLFDPSVKTYYGGAEVDLYMLATELAKDPAFSVSFICADYGQPDEQVRENVRLLRGPDFRKNAACSAVRLWRAMKKADARFYLMKTASPGVPLVYAFCRSHGRKFLYRTAHRYECDGTYRAQHPVLGRLFVRALRRAAAVFAQNEEDSRLLQQTAGVESVVIANGHRLAEPGREERTSVLWVGRSADFKYPERFLRLAEQFPQERFVMVCRQAAGDREYDALRKEAESVPNLRFFPDVDFFELGRFFAAAKVFVNTSDAEGFPNTFIQAAAAGTAILSWQVNPDQFLTKYQCGLSCGGTMERLVQGLGFLLDRQRYLEIGQNGLRYVRECHDIAVLVQRYKECLRALEKG
ncbi:MAG TPA: glycosyltransferase family 4 protein [Anaerohalosphaeraceae bacterium]|nr:glycosyltransferase family 4 protein [Anaerohalosphaeraceae bacterium]HOL88539.1 glycosyltransferase family 4 protein [Anaerohalosphaeraceae bacterium]HPP56407.1 glycosyltransferase family 4 protein [Anaerohalosphaeraceae bacterium]